MPQIVFDRCHGDRLYLCSHCVLNSPRSCPEQQPPGPSVSEEER